ncbi:MAG TPA: M15 family metallopeptidase [Candidatus Paceibacterota bacterium]|nr:M15 family metallopeptidase [Candidatus Paceibacterota bacterium]
MEQHPERRPLVLTLAGAIILLAAATGYLGYRLVQTTETADAAKVEATRLEEALAESQFENRSLEEALAFEQAKTGSFERQIKDIAGTVGTLEKLATIDPELLAKYSKVYFLNENYIPTELASIDEKYLSDPSRELQIHARAEPHLTALLEAAEEDDITLEVASAYRSFGTQAALKSNYTVQYGSGANRFSADQGYSEHQLGTTVDFTSPEIGGALVGFDTTEAYAWLVKHAHRYGFVLSYPAGNAYYQYEPWHWRYVGRALAEDLRDEDKHFYDLDQRTIDTYLVNLFD